MIRRRVALLDPKKINVGVNVFVQVRSNQHGACWAACFRPRGGGDPGNGRVLQDVRNVDYPLRVVIPDVESHDEVYTRLIGTVGVRDVSSRSRSRRSSTSPRFR